MDFVLLQATAEGSMFLIAAVAGAEGIGLIRTAQLPLAAITIVTAGLIAFLQPRLVNHAAFSGTVRVVKEAWLWGGFAVASALLIGALVWLLPTPFMEAVVGDGWEHAHHLVPVMSLYLSLGALAAALGVALRALGRLRQQVRVRIAAVPLILVAVAVCSQQWAARGAAWALVASSSLLCLAWAALLHARAQSEPAALR